MKNFLARHFNRSKNKNNTVLLGLKEEQDEFEEPLIPITSDALQYLSEFEGILKNKTMEMKMFLIL